MSEFESKIEQLAECIVVDTPFEDIEELKKILSEGKTLCWSYNAMNFRLKIWYRDDKKERFHIVVDPDATLGGYYNSKWWGLNDPEQETLDEKKLVAYKLKKIFS